jgi:hypothetical protein
MAAIYARLAGIQTRSGRASWTPIFRPMLLSTNSCNASETSRPSAEIRRSSSSAISSEASRDQRSTGLKNDDAQRLFVLAGEKILDDRQEIGLAFVGLAPASAGTEVFKHEVDVPIEPIGGNDRGRLTHTQLRNTESNVGKH